MSVHPVPYTLADIIVVRIGESLPDATVTIAEPDENLMAALTITPDLTPAQVTVLENFVVSEQAGIPGLVKADVDGLNAYLNVASPTLAQTASALKALIRVVRAVINVQ